MSTLDKLNTFEKSSLAYRLPDDLLFIIRDYMIGDYDTNAWLIDFIFNTISKDDGVYFEYDISDVIDDFYERLQNEPNQATKNMIINQIRIWLKFLGNEMSITDEIPHIKLLEFMDKTKIYNQKIFNQIYFIVNNNILSPEIENSILNSLIYTKMLEIFKSDNA